ncbi:MAG: PKD domain-containing protein [bacterium]
MNRVPLGLLLVSLALSVIPACHTDDDPNSPPPGDQNQQPGPPDYGDPPAGQNDPLRVTAAALENNKKAPFTAVLMPQVTGGVAPYTTTWDFDQNGTIDSYGDFASPTFASAGDFTAEVTVTDAANTVAKAIIEMHVLPPGPDLRITAGGQSGIFQGKAPLAVSFNTSGTTGVVKKWEWDFEGDGTIDSTSAITGNANKTYTTPGTYTPILKATDENGNTEEASMLIIATF